MDKNITLVTGNLGKVAEFERVLGFALQHKSLDLTEIQSLDLGAIAAHKAKEAYSILKTPVICDDAGLSIDAWGGFPGPFVKYIESCGGCELMLKMLAGETNRGAKFVGAIAYYDGQNIIVATGELRGTITTELKGNSWGFNPVFVPQGSPLTLAQLIEQGTTFDTHRKKAIENLREKLQNIT